MVFITGFGYHEVTAVATGQMTVKNLGYAVNDNLTLSYSDEESSVKFKEGGTGVTESRNADIDVTVSSIQGAYTMGGMTIALSLDDIENTGYVQDADETEFLLNVSMAF